MKFTQEHGNEIVDILKDLSIMPKKAKSEPMNDVYDAIYLLKEHLAEDLVAEMWPEDIGTDNDADEDYVNYMNAFSNFTKGKMAFDDISSKLNGNNVEITFKSNSKEYKWTFEQHSDSFSTEFVDLLFEHSKISGDSQFIDLKSEDMFEFAYVPKQVAEFISKFQ
ncbi:hypothetical protein [Pseudocolwellia agarivorans]|uniref:hypothetical protein n=1 Tax=Pseudocolwellia agarivorans TaxID=1911682 RepID=UPI0009852580|nr:hypothetical protein [Pseudocolwellia agarivorans]